MWYKTCRDQIPSDTPPDPDSKLSFPVADDSIEGDPEQYYMKNQQDATLAVLFISNCKITLHVSDAFYVHNQEY